jgi:hypothetical protein
MNGSILRNLEDRRTSAAFCRTSLILRRRPERKCLVAKRFCYGHPSGPGFERNAAAIEAPNNAPGLAGPCDICPKVIDVPLDTEALFGSHG